MSDNNGNQNQLPEAVPAPRRLFGFQLIWLIPLVAALTAASLAVNAWRERRGAITISFKSGEGLEANRTKIKYKEVEIGEVREVTLAPDRSRIVVTARMNRDARPLLVDDSKFWVVRPRITGWNITGLGTLREGAYIAMDVGKSEKPRKEFVALEVPPAVTTDAAGSRFMLKAASLGSLNIGSPLFYRRIQVGQIETYELNRGGKDITLYAFIRSPYDQQVRNDTFFWQASGIDLQLNTSGLKLNMESLAAVLLGGIAFDSPAQAGAAPAAQNTVYRLFSNYTEALQHAGNVRRYNLIFRRSVHGLAVGAPVEFKGVQVGEVTRIALETATEGDVAWLVPVEICIYADRLVSERQGFSAAGDTGTYLQRLIQRGLRARLASGSMLTGQRYIDLDFVASPPPWAPNRRQDPPEFPIVAEHPKELQDSLQQAAEKITALPLKELSEEVRGAVRNLNRAIQNTDRMVKNLDRTVTPEISETLQTARQTLQHANGVLASDSPLKQELTETLKQLGRAAASVRVLADYLEQHPESIIRGKRGDQP